VVWRHSLTKAQSETLEAIQHRALRIIYPPTTGMPYTFALTLPKLPSLRDRREHINRQFFRSISSSCTSSSLPITRNHDVTSRLRAASLYPRTVTRTKRYTSFIVLLLCLLFSCIVHVHFHFIIVLFILKSSGFYNLLLKHYTYLLSAVS